MKKLTALILALVMVFTIAACAKTAQPSETPAQQTQETKQEETKQETPKQEEPKQEEPKQEEQPVVEETPQWKIDHPTWLCEEKSTISVMTYDAATSAYLPPSDDVYFWQWMEEKTNVHVEWDVIPYSSYDEVSSARIAAGQDLADIVTVFSSPSLNATLINLGSNGVIVDLNQYWDTLLANTSAYFSTPETEKVDYRNRLTTYDGSLWALRTVSVGSVGKITALWNKHWMDELELEVPTTLDEFHDVLVTFQEAGDLNGDGLDNEIPLTTSAPSNLVSYFGAAFGIHEYENMGFTDFWENGDGVIFDERISEEMRTTLAYINSLYNEGLLDPEFSGGNDHCTELAASARCGCIIYYATYSKAFGRMINQFYDPDVDTKAQGIYMGLGLKTAANGNKSVFYDGYDLSDGAFVTNGENAELAIQWLDFLFASPEALRERNLGPEGLGWEFDGNGEVKILVDEEGNRPVLQNYGCGQIPMIRIGTIEGSVAGNMTPKTQWYVDALLAIMNGSDFYVAPVPNVAATEEEQDVLDMWNTDLITYYEEMRAKFIKGEASTETDWDGYVKNMIALGSDEIVGVYQSMYDRTH